MQYAVILVLALVFTQARAEGIRLLDTVYTAATVDTSIVYGQNVDAQGQTRQLCLDLYLPLMDVFIKRPLIVWLHGGGFTGGDKRDSIVAGLSTAFARRGYVCASIDYRLDVAAPQDSVAAFRSVLRAVQDAKAAIRFLVKKRSTYRVDTSFIAVGGVSSGACAVLQAAFLDNGEIPGWVDTSIVGGVEGVSGNPGYPSNIDAVVNCWGALYDTAWIAAGDPPVASFQGTSDPTLPYDEGPGYGGARMFGSAAIRRTCDRLGVPNAIKPFATTGHGVSQPAQLDTLITLTARFLYQRMGLEQGVLFDHRPGQRAGNLPLAASSVRLDGMRIFDGAGRCVSDTRAAALVNGVLFGPDTPRTGAGSRSVCGEGSRNK